jgi:hypothetical protein
MPVTRCGRFVYVATLLVAAVLLAGCGGDDERPAGDRPAKTSPTETTTSPSTRTTPADGIDPLADASTDPRTAEATNAEIALLSDVRAARHEGYDRVVFEFRNELPGYDIRYAEGPVSEDGSGRKVDVDGEHVVVVRMDNALDADLNEESAPRTYTGPTRFAPPTPVVAELVRTGGFEGVLTWAVGLRDRVDFRVTTLESPPRLVLDFRNH